MIDHGCGTSIALACWDSAVWSLWRVKVVWLAVGQPVVLPERSLEILESVRQVFHRETLAPACPVFSGGQEGLDDSVLTENCHGTGDLMELRERFRVFRRELSGIHFGTRYNPCPVDV